MPLRRITKPRQLERLASYPIMLDRRSASEIRVWNPVLSAPNPNIVTEWKLSKHATSNVWAIRLLTGRDLRGRISDVVLSYDLSVFEYAHQIGYTSDTYTSATTYDYYGCHHGHESRTSLSVKMDGVEVGIGPGPNVWGSSLVIEQAMNILKPVGTDVGVQIGTGTLKHTYSATGLVVEHTHDIDTVTFTGATELSYRTAYGAMMPGAHTVFNRGQSGADTPVVVDAGADIPSTGQQDATYSFYNTDTSVNPFKMVLTLPTGGPETTLGWANANTPSAFLHDRNDYPKWYVCWIRDAKVAAVDSAHQTHYAATWIGS